ncbi:MAG TPA: IPT/TIG domain-containing protein [Candidatus Angelobacter sp.]|nr:IPT/TIG domain-containing protein [Candidatus Angelobacter sp.]
MGNSRKWVSGLVFALVAIAVAHAQTPSISSLSPAAGPIGTSVTVSGSAFGSNQGSSTITFNGITATPTSWSDTSIAAPVPSGATTGSVVVTVGGNGSNGVSFTVTPAITGLSPASGAVNSTVTITGTSFGPSQGSSVVTFRGPRGFGNAVATVTSWSDTSIVISVPSGALTTTSVTVTVAGQASNAASFSILAPALTNLSPSSGPSGSAVTVTGSNFGPFQGKEVVSFNGNFAPILSWSDSSIVAIVPASAVTGNVYVINGTPPSNTVASNGINFTVPLVLNGISPASGIIGTSVTLFGSSFGASQGSSMVTFNGVSAAVTSWSDTTITATVPFAATTGAVVVTVGGQSSNGIAFTVPPPSISLATWNGAVGSTLTIYGTNIGSSQGASTVTLNGQTLTPASWNGSTITAPVPSGATSGNVVVTVGNQPSNAVPFTVWPVIQSVTPSGGSQGTVVTINGINFGPSSSGAVEWNTNTNFNAPISWTNTQVVVPVPPASNLPPGTGTLTVVNGFSSNGVSFTIAAAPFASPPSGSVGTAVTLHGSGFGATQGSSTLSFGGITVTPTSWSDTAVTGAVPLGLQPGQVLMAATVNGVANSAPFGVAPTITSLSPPAGAVGASVTINGNTFGNAQGTGTVTFGNVSAVPTSWNNTQIIAPVPSGVAFGNIGVTVTAGGQSSNGVIFDTGPVVQSISPAWGPPGTPVTITGLNFGSSQGSSTIQAGSYNWTPTSWSNTQIVTSIPSTQVTGTASVVVTVTGVASNNNVAVTVVPIITLSPAQGPLSTVVTINGANFGATQGASTVTVGGIITTPSAWSNTAITIPLPNGLSPGSNNVVVTVGGVSNTTYFTLAPAITSLSPSSGAAGASITVTGTSFGNTQNGGSLTFNGWGATPTSWSNTQIVAPVPANATTGNVQVNAGFQLSNTVPFTVTYVPSISSLNISSGAVGVMVEVTGSHFGATQGSSTVTFNGLAGTPAQWNDNQISVPVPVGATSGNIVVTVNGLASNGVAFTPGPSILSLTPNGGPPGISLVISGVNFGATQGSNFVEWNNIPLTCTSWSNTRITAILPPNYGNTTNVAANVVVFINGAGTSNAVNFTLVPNILLNPSQGAIGAPITITGTNFGATQGSSTVTFGGSNATPTSWSNTQIVVPVPAGVVLGNQTLTVTVGGVANSAPFGVAPGISALSPSAGPIGTVVTITGTDFGTTQGSSKVIFGSITATPTSWSDRQIVTPVPSGVTQGGVAVIAAGLQSNSPLFTVTGAPVINSFTPGEGVAGTIVILNGANFGATRGASTVTFNGTAATPVSWSNTQIAVPVPGGATSGNVVVTVGGAPSNNVFFDVNSTGPSIQSVSLAGASPGVPITITGSNFGATQGTSFVSWNNFGLMITSWSNTSITALSPNAPIGTGYLEVTVVTTASNGVPFTVVPGISFSSNKGSVGSSVTISVPGGGFGSTQGTSTLTFNGVAATPTSWSNTSITASVPGGVPAGGIPVAVTVGNIVYAGTFEVLPAISSLSPTSGAVGTIVTVTGTSFGSTQGTSQLVFGDAVATPGSWSNTSITVPVPAGASTGNVVVTVAGIPSNGVPFTVGPGISLSPVSGPVGTVVTITGTGLGMTQGTSTITFNGISATAASWSATQIVTSVPAGATTGPVVVTVGGLHSNAVNFTVTPAIASLSPASGSVGASVTITGTTFGSTQGSSIVTFNGVAATPTSWSSTQIVAPVPVAATSGNVVVTVAGNASNGLNFTVVPVISSISPGSGPVGTSVTITGTGFGTAQGSSTVTFNGVAASPTNWSASSITVAVPGSLVAGSANVVVTVNGVSSGAGAFTVTPAVTSVSPGLGPVGAQVTITGTNFGATQGSSTVALAGVTATITSWSNTSITVVVPTLPAGSASVLVTINGASSNSGSFTVTPGVTSLSPTFGAIGASVTITGTSFGATQSASTVTFNGNAGTPTTWSNTQITVPVPSGASSGNVVVTVSNLASNGVSFVVKPAIAGVSPSSATAGASVTITGTNFGATQGTSTVTFNGLAATVTSWSNTSIGVTVPVGAHTGNVEVDVNGFASNDVTFTVTGTPSITGVSPNPATIGGTVTITGTGFGATGTVTIGGVTATTTAYTDTSITATVPNGIGSLGVATVQVIVPLEPPSNPWPLSIATPPAISGLSLSTGPVKMGFVINGTGFGGTQGNSTVTINGVPPTVLNWTDTAITVQVTGAITSGPVVVKTAGGSSTGPAFTVISPFNCQ